MQLISNHYYENGESCQVCMLGRLRWLGNYIPLMSWIKVINSFGKWKEVFSWFKIYYFQSAL